MRVYTVHSCNPPNALAAGPDDIFWVESEPTHTRFALQRAYSARLGYGPQNQVFAPFRGWVPVLQKALVKNKEKGDGSNQTKLYRLVDDRKAVDAAGRDIAAFRHMAGKAADI